MSEKRRAPCRRDGLVERRVARVEGRLERAHRTLERSGLLGALGLRGRELDAVSSASRAAKGHLGRPRDEALHRTGLLRHRGRRTSGGRGTTLPAAFWYGYKLIQNGLTTEDLRALINYCSQYG